MSAAGGWTRSRCLQSQFDLGHAGVDVIEPFWLVGMPLEVEAVSTANSRTRFMCVSHLQVGHPDEPQWAALSVTLPARPSVVSAKHLRETPSLAHRHEWLTIGDDGVTCLGNPGKAPGSCDATTIVAFAF